MSNPAPEIVAVVAAENGRASLNPHTERDRQHHRALACVHVPAILARTRKMQLAASILPYIQITLAVLLVVGVLLQQTASGLGGAFGGDNFSTGFHTRRGSEKFLFQATIVVAILFVLSTFIALII